MEGPRRPNRVHTLLTAWVQTQVQTLTSKMQRVKSENCAPNGAEIPQIPDFVVRAWERAGAVLRVSP